MPYFCVFCKARVLCIKFSGLGWLQGFQFQRSRHHYSFNEHYTMQYWPEFILKLLSENKNENQNETVSS